MRFRIFAYGLILLGLASSAPGQTVVDFGQVEVGTHARRGYLWLPPDTTLLYHWSWADPPFEILYGIGPDTIDHHFAWLFVADFEPENEGVYADTIVRGFDLNGNPTDVMLILRGEGVLPTRAGDSFILSPSSFILSAYPNPFNAVSTIAFDLPTAGNVELRVYDVTGRQVNTLQKGLLSAGEHHLTFDAGDLPSGIYFARLQTASHNLTQKLLLIK